MTPPPAHPASRPALNREAICAAALALIDAEGAQALSIRALASRMGTRPMSLYRHVTDKDDILDGVVALLLDETPRPPGDGSWRPGMRSWALGYRAVLARHPHVVPLMATRAATSYASGRERVEEALTMLERAGMAPADAALVLRAVARFVVGFSLAGAGAPTAFDPATPDALRTAGLPRLARLVEGLADGSDPDADGLFVLSLEALLDGLARRVAPDGPER